MLNPVYRSLCMSGRTDVADIIFSITCNHAAAHGCGWLSGEQLLDPTQSGWGFGERCIGRRPCQGRLGATGSEVPRTYHRLLAFLTTITTNYQFASLPPIPSSRRRLNRLIPKHHTQIIHKQVVTTILIHPTSTRMYTISNSDQHPRLPPSPTRQGYTACAIPSSGPSVLYSFSSSSGKHPMPERRIESTPVPLNVGQYCRVQTMSSLHPGWRWRLGL